jgi:antitoxin MazE
MKARIVRIGNSRGVRLPKAVIEQSGLGEEVELRVQPGAILIQSARLPRAGWAAAARQLATDEPGGLLDAPTPTTFDETEWRW